MDDPQHICDACGRSFAGLGPLNYHMRSCQSGKRKLQGALSKVQQLWQERMAAKKRRRINPDLDVLSDPDYLRITPQSKAPSDTVTASVSGICPGVG